MPFPIEPFRNLSENIIGMPETCEIIRRVRDYDQRGSYTEHDQTVATTKGRVSPLSADELERYGQLLEGATAKITMPFGVDVDSTRDRIRVPTRTYTDDNDQEQVEVWDVTGVPPRSEAFQADTQVFVRRFS